MKEFMFLYKGGDPNWMANASPAEKAAVMGKWGAWFAALEARNALVAGGAPLFYSGKRVTEDGLVTDIAASEVKELVSGYSIVRAETEAAAVELTKGCPMYRTPGANIEVREIVKL